MVTPWSTNAVEICHNIGVKDIIRIEMFWNINFMNYYDPMIHFKYNEIGQQIFDKNKPEPIKLIDDIAKYNKSDGLSLSDDEILYLKNLSKKLKRKLTDSEVLDFPKLILNTVDTKIFNGKFIIDNKNLKKQSLFELIKKTSKKMVKI